MCSSSAACEPPSASHAGATSTPPAGSSRPRAERTGASPAPPGLSPTSRSTVPEVEMKTGVLAVLAAVGVAAGLVAAPRARAGQYEVHGCRLPDGGPVPA